MTQTIELKKVIFTLDIDYLELVDAIGLNYSTSANDLKVSVYLDQEEIEEYYDEDPCNFASNSLNEELGESCSKFKIYKMSKEEQEEIINNDDEETGYIYN